MPHKYDPESLAKVMAFVKTALDKGREAMPAKVSLQTRTLRYSRQYWVEATGLEEHWKDSRIDAERGGDAVRLATKNISRLKLHLKNAESVKVTIDGKPVAASPTGEFAKTAAGWAPAAAPAEGLSKRPGLQGPIDDAVVTPFLVVTPSGKCASPQVQKWVEFELAHFKDRWPAVFRGDLRIKADTEITPEDFAKYNLILWGDAKSNKVIGEVLGKLPIQWTGEALTVAGKKHDAATSVPLMIYPNPMNAQKYVVLNSGPTFREQDDANNSQQNAKWGDWAVVDVTVKPDTKTPGKVAEAGFFD
jgi:hypothetical protein